MSQEGVRRRIGFQQLSLNQESVQIERRDRYIRLNYLFGFLIVDSTKMTGGKKECTTYIVIFAIGIIEWKITTIDESLHHPKLQFRISCISALIEDPIKIQM